MCWEGEEDCLEGWEKMRARGSKSTRFRTAGCPRGERPAGQGVASGIGVTQARSLRDLGNPVGHFVWWAQGISWQDSGLHLAIRRVVDWGPSFGPSSILGWGARLATRDISERGRLLGFLVDALGGASSSGERHGSACGWLREGISNVQTRLVGQNGWHAVGGCRWLFVSSAGPINAVPNAGCESGKECPHVCHIFSIAISSWKLLGRPRLSNPCWPKFRGSMVPLLPFMSPLLNVKRCLCSWEAGGLIPFRVDTVQFLCLGGLTCVTLLDFDPNPVASFYADVDASVAALLGASALYRSFALFERNGQILERLAVP